MSNNAKVGGVLAIVSGGLGAIGALSMLFVALALQYTSDEYVYHSNGYYYYPDDFWAFITVFYVVIGVIGLLLGALGIVGGIYALRRKRWGLALAGAIASCLTFLPCGVVAVVFVAMGRPEFAANQPSPPPL
jgi:hypothetical protein